MYRQLLILQQVFRQQSGEDEADEAADVVLRAAVKEMVDELRDHASVLMSAPFPISEWRTGDGPDDERWRALTEIERRELLALIAEYEKLIAWSETACAADTGERAALGGGPNVTFLPSAGRRAALNGPRAASDYLDDCRAQLARFRKELTFLERRRGG
jgi:hypothetical protein